MNFKKLFGNTKKKEKKLIDDIKENFGDVKLGNGIGLKQGDGIYGYDVGWYPKEELLKLRREDEKENWQNVPFEDICYHISAFYYLDEKGMHFYLPQFMMASILEDELFEEEIFLDENPETHLENIEKGQFNLLTIKQVKTVIGYLEYRLEYQLLSEIQTNIECGISEEYNQSIYENRKSELLEKWKIFLSKK